MTKDSLHIAITAMGSISPLGSDADKVWKSYQCAESLIKPAQFECERIPVVATLSKESEEVLAAIRVEQSNYQAETELPSWRFTAHGKSGKANGMEAGRRRTERKKRERQRRTGVNIGSSRGATELLKNCTPSTFKTPKQRISPLTSPTTTLGSITSTVAHDIEADGPAISHSVTCSTALHAVFNGIAWMRAGMADRFIVGGAELR